MYTLEVKNDRGDILSLTNNPNYIVYKIEGLTPPQATINSSVNTTTDGSSINSARLESRNIVIYTTIEGDAEANRINLYKYFPVKRTVTLYFKNGKRNVYIEGTVEVIECDPFANKQVAQISIICPKPYFKDVNNLVTNFSDVSSLFEFPFSIDNNGQEFSAITTNIRKSIINNGDEDTGVIIELFAKGLVIRPIIYDVLNRTHMKLNLALNASDKVIINTNVGEKSIKILKAGKEQNGIGCMSMDSTWFKLRAGDNVFSYDCESGNSNLQLTFTTAVLYSGV